MLSALETSPRGLFPKVYDGFLEIDVLAQTEEALFELLLEKLIQAWNNQYILTCDVHSIEDFERSLGITANPTTENLEFRRARVANRFSMSPPFTRRWLKNKFDEIFGEGNYTFSIDYAARTLEVEAAVADSSWAQEVAVTITQVKPANMVFFNKPRISSTLAVNEEILATQRSNNYRLGVSWFLGSTPFAEFLNPEVIKMTQVSSIQPGMLGALASFAAEEIAKAVVNDTYEITSDNFTEATSDGATTTITYVVPASTFAEPITNIKLYNASNALLAEAIVYVNNAYDVSLKHTFTFKEGV